MSNTITAFFKGRIGVAESVYQYDYGLVLALDGIDDLPANFDCYFSTTGEEESIPAIGADYRIAIPNNALSRSGDVTLHIPQHSGTNDSEVEYVVTFKVIGRARPVDSSTPEEQSVISQALALVSSALSKWTNMVVTAFSLPVTADPSAHYANGTLTLGIPAGDGIENVYFDDHNCLNIELSSGSSAVSDPIQRIALSSSEYKKTAFLTPQSYSVDLDWSGYHYNADDMVTVYINGLLAQEETDYNVVVSEGAASIEFTMQEPVNEEISIRVVKMIHEG